jgi:hypothetical protein
MESHSGQNSREIFFSGREYFYTVENIFIQSRIFLYSSDYFFTVENFFFTVKIIFCSREFFYSRDYFLQSRIFFYSREHFYTREYFLQSRIFTPQIFPAFSVESDRATWRWEKAILVNLVQKRFFHKYLAALGSCPMPWRILRDLPIILAVLGQATQWRVRLGRYLDDNIHRQHCHQAWEQTAQLLVQHRVQPKLLFQFHLLHSYSRSQEDAYNTRRYFGNQRSVMKSNRWRKGKDPKTKKTSTGPFSHDIILLSGPDDKDIPRQGSKVFLQENGHIISAFEFHKEWSDIDVELEIRQAFQETLPDDVDIEIVHSDHTTLLTPTLAPGQYLTGSVINRVFSNNKPM